MRDADWRTLTAALFSFLGADDAGAARLVAAAPGAARPGAAGVARVLPQARRARRRARAARRPARLRRARGARAARGAAHASCASARCTSRLRYGAQPSADGATRGCAGWCASCASHEGFLRSSACSLRAVRPGARPPTPSAPRCRPSSARWPSATASSRASSSACSRACSAPSRCSRRSAARPSACAPGRTTARCCSPSGASPRACEFWKKYRRTLERAERKYGVPPEYVVAIIGVETFYGRNTGSCRVVDALTTLAFDYPPRADFFRSELEQYLLFARDARRRRVLGARLLRRRDRHAAVHAEQHARATRSTSTATAASTCGRAAPTRSAASPTSSSCTAGSATPTCWSTRAWPATRGAPIADGGSSRSIRWPSCARPASSSIRRSPRARRWR